MQRVGMPLLIHGEVTRPQIDVFDRERIFIDEVLIPMRRDFPELKIVFEHITTKDAVSYVLEERGPLGATITAHHLLFNRNSIFSRRRRTTWIESASLLLAGAKARDASASVAGGRNRWKLAIFSRYRFSAACERR